MIDPVIRTISRQCLIRHIDHCGIQSRRFIHSAVRALHHTGDDMGYIADIYCHAHHIIGAEQLPGRILIDDTIILHQIITGKIGAGDQFQRMEHKKVSADTDGIGIQRIFPVDQGDLAVRTVGIHPESCTGVL